MCLLKMWGLGSCGGFAPLMSCNQISACLFETRLSHSRLTELCQRRSGYRFSLNKLFLASVYFPPKFETSHCQYEDVCCFWPHSFISSQWPTEGRFYTASVPSICSTPLLINIHTVRSVVPELSFFHPFPLPDILIMDFHPHSSGISSFFVSRKTKGAITARRKKKPFEML